MCLKGIHVVYQIKIKSFKPTLKPGAKQLQLQ